VTSSACAASADAAALDSLFSSPLTNRARSESMHVGVVQIETS